ALHAVILDDAGMRAVLLLPLAACGRLDIGPQANGDAGAASDTPALPASLVCSAHVVGVTGGTSTTTDLAVAHDGSGFIALWATPGGASGALAIDVNFRATAMQTMPGAFDGVGGLVVTPSTTLVVTRAGQSQTIWSAVRNKDPVMLATESSVVGR